MSFSVCPAAVVAAPVETVWELLTQPQLMDQWIDGHIERIEPPGPVSIGQVLYVSSKSLGRTWNIVFTSETINPEKHQIGWHVVLPLGMEMRPFISCARVSPTSCRVQYG
jgi:hypothetical protein